MLRTPPEDSRKMDFSLWERLHGVFLHVSELTLHYSRRPSSTPETCVGSKQTNVWTQMRNLPLPMFFIGGNNEGEGRKSVGFGLHMNPCNLWTCCPRKARWLRAQREAGEWDLVGELRSQRSAGQLKPPVWSSHPTCVNARHLKACSWTQTEVN